MGVRSLAPVRGSGVAEERAEPGQGAESGEPFDDTSVTTVSAGESAGGQAECPKWGGMSKTCTMLNACQIERYTGFWALPGAPGVDTFSTALASPATQLARSQEQGLMTNGSSGVDCPIP